MRLVRPPRSPSFRSEIERVSSLTEFVGGEGVCDRGMRVSAERYSRDRVLQSRASAREEREREFNVAI